MNVKASDVGGPFVAWREILKRLYKKGYTLIEVLVVVIIIGVLSSMGYAGLNQAVINARTKDAARNVAAFINSIGALSTQQNKAMCLKIVDGKTLAAYKADDAGTGCDVQGGVIDKITLEAALKFVSSGKSPNNAVTVLSSNSAEAIVKHRIGYSPFRGVCSSSTECSGEGFYLIQYGSTDLYAAVAKSPSERAVVSFWGFGADESSIGWSEL